MIKNTLEILCINGTMILIVLKKNNVSKYQNKYTNKEEMKRIFKRNTVASIDDNL